MLALGQQDGQDAGSFAEQVNTHHTNNSEKVKDINETERDGRIRIIVRDQNN